MKTFFIISVILLFLTSCIQKDKVRVVLSKFPNDSIHAVIYYRLPITYDSIGIKEIYFENGKLQAKGEYKNGKRNGKWVCYRRNGKLEWRADYKEGLENGLVEFFEENGSWRKMTVINDMNNGPITELNIDSTGRKIYVFGQFKNCNEEGLWVWKNEKQKILCREFFTNGRLDKFQEIYYDNGKIFTKAFLRLGYIDSLQTFDSLGLLVKTKYFKKSTLEPQWME